MDNTYVIPKNSLKDLYDDIDIFNNKVEKFKEYQADYNYELSIHESDIEDYKWELRIKIWNDEKKRTFEEVENPFGVL